MMLSEFLGDELNVIVFKDHQLLCLFQRNLDIKAYKRLSCFFSRYLNKRILWEAYVPALRLMLRESRMVLVEFWRVEGCCCIKICFRLMMHVWVPSLIRFLKMNVNGRKVHWQHSGLGWFLSVSFRMTIERMRLKFMIISIYSSLRQWVRVWKCIHCCSSRSRLHQGTSLC